MNLKEKHYQSIEDATAGLFYEDVDYISARQNAATASTQITKDYMKRFNEWSNKYCVMMGELYIYTLSEDGRYYTHDELIEIFLYNENK